MASSREGATGTAELCDRSIVRAGVELHRIMVSQGIGFVFWTASLGWRAGGVEDVSAAKDTDIRAFSLLSFFNRI